MLELLASQQAFVGGQLNLHLDEWGKLTSDPFILMCVSNSNLEFISEPVSWCQRTLPVYQFALPEQRAIDDEIRSFLSKHIEQSHFEPGQIISPICIPPKKESGKFRVILNLQALNEYVAYHEFKMEHYSLP